MAEMPGDCDICGHRNDYHVQYGIDGELLLKHCADMECGYVSCAPTPRKRSGEGRAQDYE